MTPNKEFIVAVRKMQAASCLGGCLTLAIWALYVGLIVAGAYYIIHNGLSLSLSIGR